MPNMKLTFTEASDSISDDTLARTCFHLLMAHTRDIVLVMLPDGKIINANAAALHVYGYTMDEILQLSLHDLRAPGTLDFANLQMHRAEHSGTLFETYHQRKDGSIIPVEVNSTEASIAGSHVLLSIIRDISEAEPARHYFNTHDGLTGLFNRSYFETVLHQKDLSQYHPLGVIIGGMNGLKLVNNAFGNNCGDYLIQTTANIIQQVCRSSDIICRWGGDEFAIILPNSNTEEITKLCQHISDLCNNTDCGHLKPNMAFGFCTKEEPGIPITKVIKTAEDNMYRNKMLQSKSTRSEILSILETTLYERTQETYGHAGRMAHYCELFQQRLNLPASEMDRLLILARLHDIGKVGIPDHILNKPGPLSPSEWEIIKKHPKIGFRIAQTSLELSSVAEDILSHHERWDGKGYPRGLKGEEISLLSQIIAIIDAYDAMTHERCYKKAILHVDAIKELIRCSGSQFNPAMVNVFINCI